MNILKKKSYIVILILILLVGLGFLYYYKHYYSFNAYEKYLQDYQIESAGEFKAIDEKNCDVPGMVLVTENEYLKLYTDTKTAQVAVYDKRNKTITYSNPELADDDQLANDVNKNYLKSQFIVEYFNQARNTGTMDSYSAANLITINSLYNGIRYTYELGNTNAGNEAGFIISLEYRLDGDSLLVSVPMSMVQEFGGAKIYRIQLLKFMGAADETAEGYMLVPNASGSIINFNNGKTSVSDYSQYIYGIDPISQDYTVVEKTEKARMPLFGMSYKDKDVFAVIEDGASLAYVTASVAGKINSYNYVYPTFVLRGYDILSMFGSTGNEAELPVVEKDLYDSNLSVRYSFLDSNYKGYAGMANYYRDKLITRKILTDKKAEGDIPFFYDCIGAVKKTSHFAGIKYLKTYPMTSFEDAENISDDLSNRGIHNQIMNYQGWFNGGYYHDVADKVNLVDSLGNKQNLESLNETLKANGGRLYTDVAFQDVTYISKRYISSFESARYYGAGYVASFGVVNPANLRKTSSLGYNELRYDIISPKFLPRYVDDFADNIIDYNIDGISLRDLGDELSSDRKKNHVINREQALDVVNGQLGVLSSLNKRIMVKGGNDYSWSYADAIYDAPLNDNNYFTETYQQFMDLCYSLQWLESVPICFPDD